MIDCWKAKKPSFTMSYDICSMSNINDRIIDMQSQNTGYLHSKKRACTLNNTEIKHTVMSHRVLNPIKIICAMQIYVKTEF